MTAEELRHRWDLMLAQAQHFAAAGTFIEAIFRAEGILAESDQQLEALPEGPTKVKLETLVAQVGALLAQWRAQDVAAKQAARARGAKERERELVRPDYEELLGEGARKPPTRAA